MTGKPTQEEWEQRVKKLEKEADERKRAEEAFREREKSVLAGRFTTIIAGILILFGLYLTSLYNYLLFHSLTEIFGIVVACGIFMVTLNSRRFLDNNYFLLLGIAYLFIGGLDTIHTLAYQGMGVFQGYGADLATQLWMQARYTESISLLIAPLLMTRRIKINNFFYGYLFGVAILLTSVFYWNIFPDCFVEGVGLTQFKKVGEYVISLILIGAIFLLFQRRSEFDPGVFRLLVTSIILTICSELAFTFYISVYDFSNLVGHYLKVISFYLIYKVVIEVGLAKPYSLLFRNLKQSRERYRNLYKKTPAMLHSIDKTGRLIDVSDYWLKVMGYEGGEVLGRKSTDFLSEESRRVAEQEALPEFFRIGFADNVACQYVKKNGETMDVLLSAISEKDNEQNFIRSLAVSLDITERKRAEKALSNKERYFRSLLHSLHEDVIVVDADFRVTDVNNSLLVTTGLMRDDVIGRHCFEIMHGYNECCSRHGVECNLRKVFETGKPRNSVHKHLYKDGSKVWVDIVLSPLTDEKGNVTHVIQSMHDITAIKRTERELQRNAERLQLLREIDRAILEVRSPEEIARSALERIRKLIPCRRASILLFDYSSQEAITLAVDMTGKIEVEQGTRFLSDALPRFKTMLQGKIYVVRDILKQIQPTAVEKSLLAEGVRAFINIPLFGKDEVIGSLNLARQDPGTFDKEQIEIAREVADSLAIAIQNARLFDTVSEHRKQLSALASRLSEVEEAERQYISRELHDQVGQNLTALSINLNVVENMLPVDIAEKVRERLRDSSLLVSETTVSIRNLMSELRPPVLDDYGLIAALRWYGEQFLERFGVDVKVSGKELKPRMELATETTLFRIAQEALTNVAKHSKAGHATVTFTADNGRIRLTISDDGKGFDHRRLRRTSDRTGWGLVTMRERITALGGKLTVKSEPGEGTTVKVEIER